MRKAVTYKIKGMTLDAAHTIHNPEYSFETKNIRFQLSDASNTLELTIEPDIIEEIINILQHHESKVNWIYLGHIVVNTNLVLFLSSHTKSLAETIDYIVKIPFEKDEFKEAVILYKGLLNFHSTNYFDIIPFYENEEVQKIYWVDGENQPRFINIAKEDVEYTDDSFDFVPIFKNTAKVNISKLYNVGGLFPAGTVLYAATYTNLQGQETNIFYQSPLLYTSKQDRAGKPDEILDCGFKLSFDDVDKSFDCINVYSIIRTNKDSIPQIKLVNSIDIGTLSYHELIHTLTHSKQFYNIPDIIETEFLPISTPINKSYHNIYDFFIRRYGDWSEYVTFYFKQYGETEYVECYWETREGSTYLALDTDYASFYEGDKLLLNERDSLYISLYDIDLEDNYGLSFTYTNILLGGEITEVLNTSIGGLEIHIPDLHIPIPFVVTLTGENSDPWGSTLCHIQPHNHHWGDDYHLEIEYTEMSFVEILEGNNNEVVILHNELSSNIESLEPFVNLIYIETYEGEKIPLNETTIILKPQESLICRGDFEVSNSMPSMDYPNIISSETNPKEIKITNKSVKNIQLELEEVVHAYSYSLKIHSKVLASEQFLYNLYLENKEHQAVILDTNTTGIIQSPTHLLYVGGDIISAKTLTQKDNTLFLGNIDLKTFMFSSLEVPIYNSQWKLRTLYDKQDFYGVYSQQLETLNQQNLNKEYVSLKTFKGGEEYRFGILAQSNHGEWSDVMFLEDIVNPIYPIVNEYTVKGSYFEIVINDVSFINTLIAEGYSKIRGVVVFPEEHERNVVAQGIVAPTLIHVDSKLEKTIDNYSSWFYRPIRKTPLHYVPGLNSEVAIQYKDIDKNKTVLENRHMYTIPGYQVINDWQLGGKGSPLDAGLTPREYYNFEIQSNRGFPYKGTLTQEHTLEKYKNDYKNNFYIDNSVVTLNSPDIEFNENSININTDDLKFRIIGFSAITSSHLNHFIKAGLPQEDDSIGGKTPGSYSIEKIIKNKMSFKGYSQPANLPLWLDSIIPTYASLYHVYPWHSKGSLNNNIIEEQSGMLETKTFSFFKYSNINYYLETEEFWSNSLINTSGEKTESVGIYSEEYENIVKLKDNRTWDDSQKINYSGLANLLVGHHITSDVPRYPYIVQSPTINTMLSIYLEDYILDTFPARMSKDFVGGNQFNDKYKGTANLVPIQYKSTSHAVIRLLESNPMLVLNNRILRVTNVIPNNYLGDYRNPNQYLLYFYREYQNKELDSILVDDIFTLLNNSEADQYGGLLIGELYRDVVNNKFGGKSKNALKHNKWLRASEDVPLLDANDNPQTSITIEYVEGDTFIQRYNSVKTLPYEDNATNINIDVASVMVETRVNLDAVHGDNRTKTDFTIHNFDTYNKINPAYNQKNNYFTYLVLDKNIFNVDKFPNIFTWTGAKLSGALVDNWTNINLANTYEVDGSLGGITLLDNFKNQLIGFQPEGVYEILFNSRVQVPTSDGVPIELTNSGQVEGLRYFTKREGLSYPQSYVQSLQTFYFLDHINEKLTTYTGEGFMDLGLDKGMVSKLKTYFNYQRENPDHILKLWYDKVYEEVYINKEDSESLVFSERLGEFSSLYEYGKSFMMFNIENKFYSGMYEGDNINTTTISLYEHLNMLDNPDNSKEAYIKYLVNPDIQHSKIFDTYDLNAWINKLDDVTNMTVADFTTYPIKKLDVINTFLLGGYNLDVGTSYPQKLLTGAELIPKFRMWRGIVPRALTTSSLQVMPNPNKLPIDRFRDKWMFFTLYPNLSRENKFIMLDITFHYTI